MNFYLKTVIAGVLSVLLFIRTMYLFSSPVSYQLFALFLAYTACVYLGASLSDMRIKWISVEFGMSVVFFSFSALGVLFSPIWLGAGYILHGLYDMLHHSKVIKTKVIKWFPPLCATFDWIVAVYILVFFHTIS